MHARKLARARIRVDILEMIELRLLSATGQGESVGVMASLLKIMAGRLGEGAAPIVPRIEEQFAAHVGFMEDGINETGHFVGDDWTAADVMMSFPAEIAVMQGYGEKAPKTVKFVEAVHARPAWQRARERSGDYFIW